MKVAILLLAVVFTCNAFTIDVQGEWEKFQLKYGKIYKSRMELKKRINIFSENLKKIDEHNKLFEKGVKTYKMGITKFADLTENEFLEQITGNLKNQTAGFSKKKLKPTTTKFSNVPDALDWREKGGVSPVKDQKQCQSGWAFSVTGAIESSILLGYNKSMIISEQVLIDCLSEKCDCTPSDLSKAYDYAHTYGIPIEADYPYVNKDEPCRRTFEERFVQPGDYDTIATSGDEETLRLYVAILGPLSIGIEVSKSFQLYTSGILNADDCGQGVNHFALVVGYGTENDQEFWTIKNSFGEDWGEKGYIRLARNKDNMCSITNLVSYPTNMWMV